MQELLEELQSILHLTVSGILLKIDKNRKDIETLSFQLARLEAEVKQKRDKKPKKGV
jgi:hypothetical protein